MALDQLARQLASKGRHGDTELVHMSRGEVEGLHGLARAIGAKQGLTRNPRTGLHEANVLKSLLPTIAGAAVRYFTGSDALGAAAGAAVGAAGSPDSRLTGAITGGLGGYGGAQLYGAVEGAGGINSLFTKDGWSSFVGTPAAPGTAATGLGGGKAAFTAATEAALPLMNDPSVMASLTGTGGGSTDDSTSGYKAKPYVKQYSGGHWVVENGTPRFVYEPIKKAAAGGGIGYADGGVTSEDAYRYLRGEFELPDIAGRKFAATPARTKADVINLPALGGPAVIGGGGEGSGPGGSSSGTGESGMGTGGGGLPALIDRSSTEGFPVREGGLGGTGLSDGLRAPVAGEVDGSSLSAGDFENAASGLGLIAGLPFMGYAADKSGLAQYLADKAAAKAAADNQASVAAVLPGQDPGALQSFVDSAPLRGTSGSLTGAAIGTGGEAANAGAGAAQTVTDSGGSPEAAAAVGKEVVNEVIGGGLAGNMGGGTNASVDLDGPVERLTGEPASGPSNVFGVDYGRVNDKGYGAANLSDFGGFGGNDYNPGIGYDLSGFGDAFGGGTSGCVHVDSYLPNGQRAGDVEVGDELILADSETLAPATGIVSYSQRKTQPGWLLTAGGASLLCSASAPIPTRNGLKTPPELAGEEVAVLVDGVPQWSLVVADPFGDIEVQHITVGDKCFWAGESPDGFILHHNIKMVDREYDWAEGGVVALQNGGFVFPADVVAAVGAGSSGAGLEALAKKFGARPVQGKGHGQSDDVHAVIDGRQAARVARDEAILDAAQVARIGGGDPKRGAKKLYAMMSRVRKQATGSPKQMRVIDLNKALR